MCPDDTEDICCCMQDSDNHKAGARGKPTESDGFISKKNWDGKKLGIL